MKKFEIRFLKRIRNEEGASIIIISFAFTMITIIAALVIDLGLAYSKTAEIENAADAAALAAGRLLPAGENDTAAITLIKNTAAEYAAKNGSDKVTADDVKIMNITAGMITKIKVNIPSRVETSFAKIIGISHLDVTRSATVKISPVEKVDDAVPLSISKATMDYCIANNYTTHLALKFGGGDGTTGAYGAIDLDGVKGGGSNDYKLWLTYGYTSSLSVGETLYPVETGNMAGPTNTALTNRYSRCTHFQGLGGCNLEHYDTSCPRVVKVPIVEYTSSHYIKIRGFAAFVLEPPGDSGYIYGSFVRVVMPGVASDTVEAGDALDYGLYNVKLTD